MTALRPGAEVPENLQADFLPALLGVEAEVPAQPEALQMSSTFLPVRPSASLEEKQPMSLQLGAVLMASGAARRFGENKLLHPVEGVPMIERAMGALPPEMFAKAAVVSSYPEILRLAESKGYTAIHNPNPEQGQSVSVRLGTQVLADMDGILFAVCDQPWLQRSSVERLLSAFSAEPDGIWALSWAGRKGNPVIFPKALFPELLAITGDRGGGAVIRAHPQLLRLTKASGPEELLDIDAPADMSLRRSRDSVPGNPARGDESPLDTPRQ